MVFFLQIGTPTQRYHEYRNHAKSREIMGEALKEAYSDIFLIKANPTEGDRELIQGKFKSYHNASDNVAKLHTNTFYALLGLADLSGKAKKQPVKTEETKIEVEPEKKESNNFIPELPTNKVGLHYNISNPFASHEGR